VIDRLAVVGHWQAGDPDIVVVVDSDTIYTHVSQLAYMLADLPVELVGRRGGTGCIPLDVVGIFDYPGDFVAVIVEQVVDETEQQRCHVIDKSALSVQLARAYVTDLLDESRI
jgi:hypothetical protein